MKIVYFGSLKTPFLKEGVNKYLKLLKPFTQVELINLPSGGDINKLTREKILLEEENRFSKFYDKKFFFILLSEWGNLLTSCEFSTFIENRMTYSKDMLFLVGGYLGVSENLKKKADFILSLSKMTFTHEMAIFLLIEQVYRGIKIFKNQKYHY